MNDQYTPLEEIPKIRDLARQAFFSGKTKSITFRKQQLAQLAYLIKDNIDRFKDALKLDLGRPPLETETFDLVAAMKDVRVAYDNVEKWARPERIPFSIKWFAMGPKMQTEPKGVALIISAFNIPLFLTISPLAGAIAAGCAAVIKPSEANTNFCRLLAELVPKYLDPELYQVVLGGALETSKVLELRWDHILYIGGERVGRIVAQAAAKHLTPTTLELGGKNPVVVDPRVDPKMAARRLLWGRFTNAGQICTAPEYVLLPHELHDTFIATVKETYKVFYPDGPENSDSFARIVSQQHTARIKRLLDGTQGTIVCGGTVDVENKYIAPTVVDNVGAHDSLMSEEIFGPVLPIVPVKDVDEAIAFIQSRENPLAVYVFSPDQKFQKKVFENTRSGAALANDTVISPGVPYFPVGGIGASGHGYYAGKKGFEEFSHIRVSLDNPSWVDKVAFGFRFPPYGQNNQKYTSRLYPPMPPRPNGLVPRAIWKRWVFWVVTALIGASSALVMRYRAAPQIKV